MNTQRTSTDQRRKTGSAESWPFKLNKALIAIGVIAFGLIVTDRLLEAFRADDAPAVASVDSDTLHGTDETAAPGLSEADQILPEDRESLVALQKMFGSRVVFVSATEPGYIVTEDERRIAVGDAVDDAARLAGVTTHQLILDKGGDLMVFNLPDPVLQ